MINFNKLNNLSSKNSSTIIILVIISSLSSYFFFLGKPPFLGDATYIDLNVTNSIIQGIGAKTGPNLNFEFTDFVKRPPGYSFLIALISFLGVSIITSAKILSFLSFVILIPISYLILNFFISRIHAFIFSLFILFYVPIVNFSKIAAPEIVSILFLSLTFLLYLKWLENLNLKKINYTNSLLLGVFLGSLLWIKYTNGIFFLLFFSFCFAAILTKLKSHFSFYLPIIISSFFTFFLFLRNFIVAGNIFGHPVNNTPTNPFDVAIIKCINSMFQFNIDINFHLAAFLIVIAFTVATCLIISISVKSKNIFYCLPIALLPIGYLLFFSFSQSTARIDDVSTRYTIILFWTFILQMAFLYNVFLDFFKNKKYIRMITNIILLVTLASNILYSSSYALKIRSFAKKDSDYSPHTLEYINKNIPKGSLIIGSRYLSQILITSLDYPLSGLRFYSKYNEDYGRKLSTSKSDLLKLINKNNAQYIVFFQGKDNVDPFLQRGDYGEFITNLYDNKSEFVKKKIKLNDGVILELNTNLFKKENN
jgi:hypothetical protein